MEGSNNDKKPSLFSMTRSGTTARHAQEVWRAREEIVVQASAQLLEGTPWVCSTSRKTVLTIKGSGEGVNCTYGGVTEEICQVFGLTDTLVVLAKHHDIELRPESEVGVAPNEVIEAITVSEMKSRLGVERCFAEVAKEKKEQQVQPTLNPTEEENAAKRSGETVKIAGGALAASKADEQLNAWMVPRAAEAGPSRIIELAQC